MATEDSAAKEKPAHFLYECSISKRNKTAFINFATSAYRPSGLGRRNMLMTYLGIMYVNLKIIHLGIYLFISMSSINLSSLDLINII